MQVVCQSFSCFHQSVNTGKVTLVGAGPGDPELLTLKAVKAIEGATVLLVDDLVGPDIVAFASPGARIVHVGKRGGCKSTPQAFIEKLMVMAAREGEVVVRVLARSPLARPQSLLLAQRLRQAAAWLEKPPRPVAQTSPLGQGGQLWLHAGRSLGAGRSLAAGGWERGQGSRRGS